MEPPGAPRVLVLVPCMLETDLQALERQARSQCTHPPGWDIAYRRCDPRDRIGAYNAALAESTHDMLVLVQPYLRLYQPALFTELARALQEADVVGCGGALRWVQKDWTLDLPAYKAWGLLRPSPVREGMVDMHLAGDFDGPLVPGAVVLDGKFLACKPAAVRGSAHVPRGAYRRGRGQSLAHDLARLSRRLRRRGADRARREAREGREEEARRERARARGRAAGRGASPAEAVPCCARRGLSRGAAVPCA